jgi:hypothetical protein
MRIKMTVLLLLMLPYLYGELVRAQDGYGEPIDETIYIFQSGQIVPIQSDSNQRASAISLQAEFMPEANLSALWTSFDPIFNRVYMIVEQEPFNYQTLRQLRSLVMLDMATGTQVNLYTDYDLIAGRVSPDGMKLLINQYIMDGVARMPRGSNICIFDVSIRACNSIELEGILSQFDWFNNQEFIFPLNGSLYRCNTSNFAFSNRSRKMSMYIVLFPYQVRIKS